MDIEEARTKFVKLVDDLDKDHLADFFSWIQSAYLVSHCRGHQPAIAHSKFQDICKDVRDLVPISAILPSEYIVDPEENLDPEPSIHVDAFLFDDFEIDELVDEEKLSRNYCLDCKSQRVTPLTFLTHSASRRRVYFLFDSQWLPYLEDKCVLDVGSRLGAIIFGAYVFSAASKIIGVEMNSDLCEIQRKVVEKNQMQDRIQIINSDIRDASPAVQSADVVILNNVFEYFLPPDEQTSCWKFMRANVKKGAILVTIPSLEESLKPLDTGIDISTWARRRKPDNPLLAMTIKDTEEISEMVSYDIIG